VTLRLDRARSRLISGFIDAYLKLNATEQAEFDTNIKDLGIEQTEKVMEIVTSWMEEGIKRGRKEGREKGLLEGLQKGRQEGRQEGLQAGRQEASLQTAQDDIIEILEARFARVPVTAKKEVRAVTDRQGLRALLREAATSTSLKEFRQRLTRQS